MSPTHKTAGDTGPAYEPEWPTDDPSALAWWLEEGGEERLGRDVNKWVAVISYAASRTRHALSAHERRQFRDVALAAATDGRRMGGLPDNIYIEKVIYTRMSYIRKSAEDLYEPSEWYGGEMAAVLDFFRQSFPMGASSAREKSKHWQTLPVQDIKVLRNIKTLLRLMEPGICYLEGSRREVLDEWLRLIPLLP